MPSISRLLSLLLPVSSPTARLLAPVSCLLTPSLLLLPSLLPFAMNSSLSSPTPSGKALALTLASPTSPLTLFLHVLTTH